MVEPVSLYFHIPFCTKKCPYCHFYVLSNRPSFHDLLKEGLQKEWDQKLPLLQGKIITSIYFGGGTPALFAPEGIGAVLHMLRQSISLEKGCEITVEVNPENGDEQLFEQLVSLGVNRLSFGVQSLDDRSLHTLERTHSASQAKHALQLAHASGCDNLSIDLMYDLPDQTEASFRYTLDALSSLPIRHLSLYNLTIEPHTAFYARRSRLSLPNAETSLCLLQMAIEAIEALGFQRYEISAFAQPGFISHHNTGYWTARPFLGYGPSAFSYWEGERFRNIASLSRYHALLQEGRSPVDFSEKLPSSQSKKELIAIHLRLLEGVELKRWDPLPEDLHLSLERLEKRGWLCTEEDRIRLTKQGLLFYDELATEII